MHLPRQPGIDRILTPGPVGLASVRIGDAVVLSGGIGEDRCHGGT
jgi:hypothetical protein